MSSISTITSFNNLSLQHTSNATQSARRHDSDSDDNDSKRSGRAGRSNFLVALEQALIQTLSNGSNTSSSGTSSTASTSNSAPATDSPSTTGSSTTLGSTQSPQESLKAFIHSLFAALHAGGHSYEATTSDASTITDSNTPTTGSTPATGSVDSNGDDDGTPTSRVGHHEHGHQHERSNLVDKIQSLLQQLTANSPSSSATNTTSTSTDSTQNTSTASPSNDSYPLGDLKSSFQAFISTLLASQNQDTSAAAAPTLQDFLQNLVQALNGGHNVSGAVIDTQA